MIGIGVLYTFFAGIFAGVWFILIGFFLRNAAVASYEQLLIESTLSHIRVRDMLRTDLHTVPPEMTLEELVNEHIFRGEARCYAVFAAGQFLGLVTISDVRKIAREEWSKVTVYKAMTPASKLHTVSPDENLARVLQLMSEHDINQLPVLRGQHDLLGIVTRADIMRYIQIREDLGQKAADTFAHQDPAARPPENAPAPGQSLSGR